MHNLLKLVIVIPAFNEEKNIGKTIQSIPKKIHGITKLKKKLSPIN